MKPHLLGLILTVGLLGAADRARAGDPDADSEGAEEVPQAAATPPSFKPALLDAAVEPLSTPPREPIYVRPEVEPRIGQVVVEGADAADVKRQLELLDEGAPLDLRAVREAVRQLHTSRRFARVAAFVEPMPPRPGAPEGQIFVRLVFQLAPVLEIRSLAFPGHRAIAESVLKSTANLSGSFSGAQIQRAVADVLALYAHAGYRKAGVTVKQKIIGGSVALELAVREGPPTRIADVRFLGELGLAREDLLNAFRLAGGDVLNQSLVEDGVRALRERYRKAGRLRARIEAPQAVDLAEDRVRLVVKVQAGPKVSFHIRGNRAFSDRVLLAKLSLDGDEPLDAQAVQEMAARLRRFYVGQGFLKVRLLTREIVGKDSEVQVFFSVFEDKPVRVERIVFTGQSAIPTEQLEELIESVLREGTTIDPAFGADPSDVERTGVAGRPAKGARRRYHVDPTTIFDTVLYARAIREIEDLYKSQGFLNVQVGPPKLAIAEANARGRVVIPIREGEQARVASLRVEGGGGGVSQAELAAALTLQKGGVFSYLAAEEGRGRITQLFTGRGHLYAKVEDDETFDEPDHKSGPRPIVRVQVTYRVQPGPLVRVTLVKIESPDALRTLEGLIYDLMDIKVGDVLKPETLDRAQQALLRTGLFFSATLTPLNPQLEEGEKVLQVSLRERPTQSFLGSIGFSLTDGPRTTLQFQQANLFGRNLTFSAVGKADFPFIRYGCNKVETLTTAGCSGVQLPNDSVVDAIERVVDIGLSTQRLYPFANSLRASLDLIHERANRPSYTLTKFSAQTTAESVRRRPWSASLTLEVGKQIFADTRTSLTDFVSQVDRKLFLQPVGEMIFGSLRPTLTLDLRDEPGRTRKGFFAQLAGDYMKSLSDTSFHTHILRLQGLTAGYLPLPLGSSLVLSARAGYVFHFDDEKKTPPDRHFYLGGATTLRGFAEDSLQAEDARKSVVNSIAGCKAVVSGLACTRGAQSAILGDSSGGDVMVAVRAEARVAVGGAWELAFFYDRGNLLADPGAPNISWRDLLNPHHAVGSGVRYATPIGRMALDLGVNLNPDDELGERRLGLYFSIDTL